MADRPTKHPTLYELNTRAYLSELSARIGRRATLDDLPASELDRLAGLGFEWIWLLGVWQTGEAGRQISRTLPALLQSYEQVLPDVVEADICGSPFAIVSYDVSPLLGGNDALARLRKRMRDRGMRLMLDFVPNHTALDHPWAKEHPEYYVRGSDQDIEREPSNYVSVPQSGVFAYGRDPYFPGWSDTLQLNYGTAELQEAMRCELMKVAAGCDGVRCDMAMLLTPEVFRKTWGIEMQPFWPETIRATRAAHPGFVLMAEVYWDMEWELQQQGFDYTYDKRLYDRLRSGDAAALRAHLGAQMEFQNKSVRFLENHDEERAAEVFPPELHKAAAMITYFIPGLRFFHDGQLEGRHKRASVHLCRRARETPDPALNQFYTQLLEYLKLPAVRNGEWRMAEATPESCFAFEWQNDRDRALVIVNFSREAAECHADGLASPFHLPAWGYKIITAA